MRKDAATHENGSFAGSWTLALLCSVLRCLSLQIDAANLDPGVGSSLEED